MRIVVALGGNSLIRKGQTGIYQEQSENIRDTCGELAKLVDAGHDIIITFGNGPQVGNILLQQESTKDIPPMPLDVCVAMTQGQIGYMIQSSLKSELGKLGIRKDVVTVLTQVIVDSDDSAFKRPTKPVGPYYKDKRFNDMIFVGGRGHRRLVPSPRPVDIVEKSIIKKLIREGCIVIAGGGGGVPVVKNGGRLSGVEGVVDKDLTSALLARLLKAEMLLILLAAGVFINYGTPSQKKLDRMNLDEAGSYLREGQFGEGSMKPKIEACMDFLENGGKKCVICLPEEAADALKGGAGTFIEI